MEAPAAPMEAHPVHGPVHGICHPTYGEHRGRRTLWGRAIGSSFLHAYGLSSLLPATTVTYSVIGYPDASYPAVRCKYIMDRIRD